MLDLTYEVENRVREYAAREGLNASDYIARLLADVLPDRDAPQATESSEQGSPQARKAPRLRVLPREQSIRQNAVSIQRLEAELAEAENAGPEEAAQADADWQSLKQALNDNRRASGERLLFPDTPLLPQP